jgi:hypothetical protein
MRYSLVLLPLLLGLMACTIETPAPVQHTTYVTPVPTTTYTYVPAAPSTTTVVRTPY